MFEDDIDEIFDPVVAEFITLDGVQVRVLPGNVSVGPSTYHGEIRTTWDFTAAAPDLNGRQLLPEMDVDIDGLIWEVDQVTRAGSYVVDVVLSRRAT